MKLISICSHIISYTLTSCYTILLFSDSSRKHIENAMGKEENAGTSTCTFLLIVLFLFKDESHQFSLSYFLFCQIGHRSRPYRLDKLSLDNPLVFFSPNIFNSLRNGRVLHLSNLKAFADNKLNVAQMMEYVAERVKKKCGKRRKCRLAVFYPFPTIFLECVFFRVVKTRDLVEG